jgi:uncharacterized protein YkwD
MTDDVRPDARVEVTFDEVIDPASAPGAFSLSFFANATVPEVPVRGTVAVGAAGKSLILTPAAPMSRDGVYIVTVGKIRDTAGNERPKDDISVFTVNRARHLVPSMTLTAPVDGSIHVAPDVTLKADSNVRLIAGTVKAQSSAGPCTGTVQLSPDGFTTCLPGVTIAEAVAKLNAARAVGRMCGSTWYPAAPEVKWSEALARAASGHSQDMATQNYFSHTSLDGRSPGTRITAAGYSWNAYGENIAAGQSTMDAAMAAWLPSPGHCKNIMNPRYTDYAIGCAYKSSARYRTSWTQDFAAPRATR